MTVLFFCCQSFQCEEVCHSEIYFGGIVKDRETREPLTGIEVYVKENGEKGCTDETGKFGFIENNDSNTYRLYFRDIREEKIYADWDTLVFSRHEKILVEVLLRKKR